MGADPAAPPPPSSGGSLCCGSIWSHKPWWCQPWSILLTGIAIPAASWCLLQRWWITAPLAAAILVWWWLFLVLVPAAWRAEQGGQAQP
ncbi:MAG: DUF6737 family protein [Synechococcaceae cyanobacterium ELA739]